MAAGATPGREVVLETDRLLLRPWRVSEAVVQRELWTERDPRVPPHRRIDADGRPTVADLEEAIRTNKPWEWNTASRCVLAKVGFTETARTRPTAPPCSPQDGSDTQLLGVVR